MTKPTRGSLADDSQLRLCLNSPRGPSPSHRLSGVRPDNWAAHLQSSDADRATVERFISTGQAFAKTRRRPVSHDRNPP
jgi:hypothetical protein